MGITDRNAYIRLIYIYIYSEYIIIYAFRFYKLVTYYYLIVRQHLINIQKLKRARVFYLRF